MNNDERKILDRPVTGERAPKFAYACGHEFVNGANMASIKCPDCRAKE